MSGSSIKQYLENHKTEIVLGVLFFSFILGWNIINSAMSGIIINDGGWHIRLGEEILKQKHVNIAPYAWHASLKTTHNHEWLYDVIIYLLSGGNLYTRVKIETASADCLVRFSFWHIWHSHCDKGFNSRLYL